MRVCVTGSLGLVGSTAVHHFLNENCAVIGIDNDMRKHFFGEDASCVKNRIDHRAYVHYGIDISKAEPIIANEKPDVIIHAAAQPSHDFSAKDPLLDFGINAYATLMLLEFTRKHCPEAVFVYLSTNKVYGDRPNNLPILEYETRYEAVEDDDIKLEGISEIMPVDYTTHSPFGVSKLAGDLYAQEYARYFGLKTGIFRCGCITGSAHAGAELHGFLAYMARCKKEGIPYKVYGYKGKQVRDQIHAKDLVKAIHEFIKNPRPGEVYNMGGGRDCNVSVLEALNMMRIKDWTYTDQARKGDHIWYISDTSKFQRDYPSWKKEYNLWAIFDDLMRVDLA